MAGRVYIPNRIEPIPHMAFWIFECSLLTKSKFYRKNPFNKGICFVKFGFGREAALGDLEGHMWS